MQQLTRHDPACRQAFATYMEHVDIPWTEWVRHGEKWIAIVQAWESFANGDIDDVVRDLLTLVHLELLHRVHVVCCYHERLLYFGLRYYMLTTCPDHVVDAFDHPSLARKCVFIYDAP